MASIDIRKSVGESELLQKKHQDLLRSEVHESVQEKAREMTFVRTPAELMAEPSNISNDFKLDI